MKIFKLENVSLDMLKTLFEIMSKVNKTDDTINFMLSNSSMSAINSNQAESVFKRWVIKHNKIASGVSGELMGEIKVSIFNGKDFSKKILGFFGQMANIEFYHDGKDVMKIVLKKLDKDGKVMLNISCACADTSISFNEYPQDSIEILFGLGSDYSPKTSFMLIKEDILNIIKLSALNSNSEEQKKYVKIYSENGSIKATDNAFDVVLGDDVFGLNTEIEIDKSILPLIDGGDYKVELTEHDDLKFIILTLNSDKVDNKITINLLSDISTDVQWDEFQDFGNSFE